MEANIYKINRKALRAHIKAMEAVKQDPTLYYAIMAASRDRLHMRRKSVVWYYIKDPVTKDRAFNHGGRATLDQTLEDQMKFIGDKWKEWLVESVEPQAEPVAVEASQSKPNDLGSKLLARMANFLAPR